MQKLSILQFHKEYPDNDTCLERLFRDRYSKPTCPVCKRVDQYHRISTRARYSCSCGKHHIFPKKGTIFQKSDTDLVKWFFAIYLFSQSRNGVAAKELERELGVTYKTAWRMAKEIRKLMTDEPSPQKGEVEADETWIGGKRKYYEPENKTIVFGSVERNGRVNAQIVKDSTEETLQKYIRENVARGSKLLTDEWRAYKNIAHLYGYGHDTVNHSAKQYAKPNGTHTNTIEGFWSNMKRSIDGTYHAVSPKYLSSYLGEFVWRYNHARSSVHLFDLLLGRVSLPHVAAASRISAFR